MTGIRVFIVCALAAAVGCYANTPPVLYITDGTNSVTVDSSSPGSPCPAHCTNSGAVIFLGSSVSAGMVSATVLMGSPGILINATGTIPPATGGMTVNDVAINATSLGSAGTITARFTATGFFEVGPTSLMAGGSTLGGGTAGFTGYIGNSNAECTIGPCTGTKIGPLGPLSGSFSASFAGPSAGTVTPYSLTSEVVLTVTTFNTSGGDFAINQADGSGCPATKGYWKNAAHHPFPSGLTFNVPIGGVSYSRDDFYTILGLPGGGNAVAIMGSQLVAAILNEAASGQVNSTVANAIAKGELYVNGINMTSGYVSTSSTLGQEMLAVGTLLTGYNTGFFGTCVDGTNLQLGQ